MIELEKLTENEKNFYDLISMHKLYTDEPENQIRESAIHETGIIVNAMVNNFSFHEKELVSLLLKEPDTESDMIAFACAWVEFWYNQPPIYFDGRNEIAGNLLKTVHNMDAYSELQDDYAGIAYNAYYAAINDFALRMHRTLMQTFTGFILRILANSHVFGAISLSEQMTRFCGFNDWYNLPMI